MRGYKILETLHRNSTIIICKMRSVTTLVLTLLVCGCISNPQISIDDVGQIDISNSLVKGEKVLLSTIAKDVKYIELQSDCNCLLGRIEIPVYGVKVHKDRLFISDESRILSFDKNGKFLAQIGSQGRGPGEYMYPDDFAILNESDKIAVFSQPSKKVFFYSLDGIFEKDISIDFYPTRMISFMNKLVFISPPGRRDLTDYFTLTIMEESGEIFSRLLKRENEKELDKNNDIALRAYSFQTYVMDSSLYYFEKYYDTIWRVSSEFTIDSKTHFYYGDDRRSIDDVLKLDPSKKTVPTAEILSDAMSFVIPQWYIDSHRFSFFRIGLQRGHQIFGYCHQKNHLQKKQSTFKIH